MASKMRVVVRGLGVGLCATAAFGPIAAYAAAASDLYYERTVMTAADQRCRLFAPGVGLALAAGQAQARGAALRAGVDRAQLSEIETRARNKAGAQACNSPDLLTAVGRVKIAFEGFASLMKMNYPGEVAGWTADRAASKTRMVWNLSQPVRFGADQLTFGLANRDGARSLLAVVRFSDGAQPYAARIVMRDGRRAPQPYLDKRKAVNGTLPLTARVAPRVATNAYVAEARFAPDALLVPTSMKGAVAYQFPAAAARALADLDPREAVEVEFLFSGAGAADTVRRAYVEVGDFAAGRAFLASTAP